MEIGHNVLHGQWDWMNDPEIHSATWEWDMVGVAKHWRITHNVSHHTYTNIIGMDDDARYRWWCTFQGYWDDARSEYSLPPGAFSVVVRGLDTLSGLRHEDWELFLYAVEYCGHTGELPPVGQEG